MEAAMLRRAITSLILAAALLLPLAHRADDREWEEDYTDQWSNEPPAGNYDVSVDELNSQGTVTPETFQGALAPYGDWMDAPSYGRVWRPHVAAGWRPYYYGRWEWTNEGWLWVSDEPFGWAAYHYGRWTYDNGYGWLWVPGYQWAPAWVAWRYSGDVVGWAPLGPGVSVYVSSYPFVDFWWTFVPTPRFCSVPVYSVAYAPGYTRRYFYATAPAPPLAAGRPVPGGRPMPRPAWGGPAPTVIEQRIGRPLTPARIVSAPAPGAARMRPGEVAIYRPEARPAPAPGGRAGFGRGPGPAPVQGNGAPRGWAPGGGSGHVAPAPGWGGGGRAAVSQGGGRGPAPAPAPGWMRGGGAPSAPVPHGGGAPQAQPQQHGGGGGGRPVPANRGHGGERRER